MTFRVPERSAEVLVDLFWIELAGISDWLWFKEPKRDMDIAELEKSEVSFGDAIR